MRKYRLIHLVIACFCCICITVVIMRTQICSTHARVYFSPGPECENNIIAAINKSQQIDVAVYSITNTKIADALVNAQMRGAKIRIVTDRTQAAGRYSLIGKLRDAGLSVRIHRGYKIEHNKFALFDNKRVVTGSYNWTTGATKHNSENCVFLSEPIQEYKNRFDELWGKYGSNRG